MKVRAGMHCRAVVQRSHRPASQPAADADLVVRGHVDRFVRVPQPDPGMLHGESRTRVFQGAEQHAERVEHMGNRNGQHRRTVFARLVHGLGTLNALSAQGGPADAITLVDRTRPT